jgi:hypothetical protein
MQMRLTHDVELNDISFVSQAHVWSIDEGDYPQLPPNYFALVECRESTSQCKAFRKSQQALEFSVLMFNHPKANVSHNEAT